MIRNIKVRGDWLVWNMCDINEEDNYWGAYRTLMNVTACFITNLCLVIGFAIHWSEVSFVCAHSTWQQCHLYPSHLSFAKHYLLCLPLEHRPIEYLDRPTFIISIQTPLNLVGGHRTVFHSLNAILVRTVL